MNDGIFAFLFVCLFVWKLLPGSVFAKYLSGMQ